MSAPKKQTGAEFEETPVALKPRMRAVVRPARGGREVLAHWRVSAASAVIWSNPQLGQMMREPFPPGAGLGVQLVPGRGSNHWCILSCDERLE